VIARGRRASAPTAAAMALLLALGSAPAWAQGSSTRTEDEAAARSHFERGSKLYEQGKYLDAAREFEAGYQSAPRPLFLLNIGHSYRRSQDLRKAKAAYEKLLRTDPTTPQRPMVEDLIKTIDDALTVQELAIPVPARPSTRPLPPAGSVPPEPRGQVVDPTLVTAPAPEPAPPTSTWMRNPWAWGILAGVITAGVAGTVFALTRSPPCPANTCWREP
jgi:tetratricopeptide (TPR) repeat protein